MQWQQFKTVMYTTLLFLMAVTVYCFLEYASLFIMFKQCCCFFVLTEERLAVPGVSGPVFGCCRPAQHQRICCYGDLWWFPVPAVAVGGLKVLAVWGTARIERPLWLGIELQCRQIRNGHHTLAGPDRCNRMLWGPSVRTTIWAQLWVSALVWSFLDPYSLLRNQLFLEYFKNCVSLSICKF